jgi:hypothetical protein
MKIYCGDVDFLYKSMINQLDLSEHTMMMPYSEFKSAINSQSLIIVKNCLFMSNIGVLSDRVKSFARGETKPLVIDFLNNSVTLN